MRVRVRVRSGEGGRCFLFFFLAQCSPVSEVSVSAALQIRPHPHEGEVAQAVFCVDEVVVEVAQDTVELCVGVVLVLVLDLGRVREVVAFGRVLLKE